jgi:iron complex transport system substrate-binding protein
MRKPERIVTLGWNGEDVILALGDVPIAMSRYSFFPDGIFPWNKSKLGEHRPVLLDGEIDYEAVALLQPDVILAVYADIDAIAYNRLSSIAPTIIDRSGPWQADWKEQAQQIGSALGKERQAKALVGETEAFLRELGRNHSDLVGKTFTFGSYMPGSGGIVVYLPADPRVQALISLGMLPSAGVAKLAQAHPRDNSAGVSLEEIGAINADILIMWYREGASEAAESQPLFRSLPVVRNGGYVALEDPVLVTATSALSVLNIPYAFPDFIARLSRTAAAKAEER